MDWDIEFVAAAWAAVPGVGLVPGGLAETPKKASANGVATVLLLERPKPEGAVVAGRPKMG